MKVESTIKFNITNIFYLSQGLKSPRRKRKEKKNEDFFRGDPSHQSYIRIRFQGANVKKLTNRTK
jgi:hypothetical protein